MRLTYAIRTEVDPAVKAWFMKVDQRLKPESSLLIRGGVKSFGKGAYVVSVEPVIDLWGFLMGPAMLMLSGVLAWVLFGSVGWSNWLVGIGLAGMVLVYSLMAPGVHRLMMRLTLRRLTGRWVMVRPATSEVFWEAVHGKV